MHVLHVEMNEFPDVHIVWWVRF